MSEQLLCSACGKDMSVPEEESNQVVLSSCLSPGCLTISFDHLTDDIAKIQLGPYATKTSYSICWECVLKTLGIKP